MSAEPNPAGIREPPLLVAFAPFAIWSPHFETDLEIIQNHLDIGGGALVLSCEGQLKTCEPNPRHQAIICALCRRRFRKGMEWLQGDRLAHESFYQLEPGEAAVVEELGQRRWRNLDELRHFHVDGADVGLAAVSSVVSLSREPEPDVERHREALADNLASSAMVYFSLRRKLADNHAGILSLFNGRFAALRPALRAARQLGITSLVHERAGDIDRYSVTPDTYPHDISAMKREIEATYQRSGGSELARQQAMEWYEERRLGISRAWLSFTAEQDPGQMPANLDPSRKNVVIFISSEDEFVAIPEWDNPFYANQNEGITRLLADLEAEPELQFFLRVHPNLADLWNSQVAGIEAMSGRFRNLTVIPAGSAVSSYALMGAADLVITYGSTVGIEAAYSGKVSILMGRALHEDLGVCIKPKSHEHLVELLLATARGDAPQQPDGVELGLAKFGHFNRVSGNTFRHALPDGLFSARMRSGNRIERLGRNLLLDFVHKLVTLLEKWRRAIIRKRESRNPRQSQW